MGCSVAKAAYSEATLTADFVLESFRSSDAIDHQIRLIVR